MPPLQRHLAPPLHSRTGLQLPFAPLKTDDTHVEVTFFAVSALFAVLAELIVVITLIMAYRLNHGTFTLPHRLIDITGDEDSEDDLKPIAKPNARPSLLIELDDDDDQERVDLTGDDDDVFIRELSPNEFRRLQSRKGASGDVLQGYKLIGRATTKRGTEIVPSTAEEPVDVELHDGDFLRVLNIYQHIFTQEVILKGILLRRTRRVYRYFKKNRNELCAILQQNEEDENPAINSALVTRPLTEVYQVRNITFTNQPFPRLSFREDAAFFQKFDRTPTDEEIEHGAVLVCRTKHIECCNTAKGKVTVDVILNLLESESDPGKGSSDIAKKYRWLEKPFRSKGHSVGDDEVQEVEVPVQQSRRDSKTPVKQKISNVIDLTNEPPNKKRSYDTIDLTEEGGPEEFIKKIQKHSIKDTFRQGKNGRSSYQRRESVTLTSYMTVLKSRSSSTSSSRTFGRPTPIPDFLEPYTYGDICAGAGGMARGAAAAGLAIAFLLDHWDVACNTLRKNWRDAKVLDAEIFSFCVEIEFGAWMRVDILHISFPCQTHSLAHTREGKNDEANEASALSVLYLLKRCRPRVVTFEQTWSILTDRRRPHFEALINQLTVMGFNVRWKVFLCSEYGNVQPRKRLFIIASCPGEPLPPFPKPTHGPVPGRKPFVTIADRLALVPANIPQHMRQDTKKNSAPYNPNHILRHAITCDGGEGDKHPDGGRSFNMAELASLGGFPAYHRFTGCKTAIRKQIGNAVPSMVGKLIFEEIQTSMRQADKHEAGLGPDAVREIQKELAGRDKSNAIEID